MASVEGVRRVGGWVVVDVDVTPPRWRWSADILLCRNDPDELLRRYPGCAAVVYLGNAASMVVIRAGTGSPVPA